MSLPSTGQSHPCTLCGESRRYPVEVTEHAGWQDVEWAKAGRAAVFDTRYFCGRLCLQAWLNLERMIESE